MDNATVERHCFMASDTRREHTKAGSPQHNFNPFNTGARTPAGAPNRTRLALVVLLGLCVRTGLLLTGPVHVEAPVCQIPDLMLFVAQQGATMHVVGGFTLRNVGAQPCLLPPVTRVEMLDSSGSVVPMPIENRFDPAISVLLPPDQEVGIAFTWFMLKERCPATSAPAPDTLRLSTDDASSAYILHFGGTSLRTDCGTPELPFGRLVIGPYSAPGPSQPIGMLMRVPLTGTSGSAGQPDVSARVVFALSALLAATSFVLVWRSREPV